MVLNPINPLPPLIIIFLKNEFSSYGGQFERQETTSYLGALMLFLKRIIHMLIVG